MRGEVEGEGGARYAIGLSYGAGGDEKGFAINRGEWRESVAGVGAPVRDSTGRVIAAIGISGPTERLKYRMLRGYGPRVREAADAVSAALGFAVARDLQKQDNHVVAVIGDGAAMYGIQGLWTAAHYRLPVTFVITNNGAYSILKERLVAFGGSSVAKETMIGMDFVNPSLDFVGLAQSMGVPARRVSDPAEVAPALRWALAQAGPVLLDVIVYDGFKN